MDLDWIITRLPELVYSTAPLVDGGLIEPDKLPILLQILGHQQYEAELIAASRKAVSVGPHLDVWSTIGNVILVQKVTHVADAHLHPILLAATRESLMLDQ